MAEEKFIPIQLDFKSVKNPSADPVHLRTFTSYAFERSVLVPASAFRFTAPGVSKATKLSIRSGDLVSLYVAATNNITQALGTGIVDETDTHETANSSDYAITGRDMMGQLVDNPTIDAANHIINTKEISLDGAFELLIKNTRLNQEFIKQQIPTVKLLFNTHGGETKISALQRYLEFTNCLVWTAPDGRAVLGKPNFYQPRSGKLICNQTSIGANNVVDYRVRRNLNQAIRQIVTQLQTMEQVDAGSFTKVNADKDMAPLVDKLVGRSVYAVFSYGQGTDAVNQIFQVGNGAGAPRVIGEALSLRELAKENMKVIDVEMTVEGHTNENGLAYNIDQVYSVEIEEEDVAEDLYVYSCSYELTPNSGAITRLRLCRLGTICADAAVTGSVATTITTGNIA